MSIINAKFNGSFVVKNGSDKEPVVYHSANTNKTGINWRVMTLEHNLESVLDPSLLAVADVTLHATVKPKKGLTGEFRAWFDKQAQPVITETAEQAEFRAWKASKAAQTAAQPVQPAQDLPQVGLPGLPQIGQQASVQEERMVWAARASHIQSTKHYESLSTAHQSAVTSWLGEFESLVRSGSLSDTDAVKSINEALPTMGFKAKIK